MLKQYFSKALIERPRPTYMYVCVYIYIHIYTHTNTHTHTHTHIHKLGTRNWDKGCKKIRQCLSRIMFKPNGLNMSY
jgi:hypothetical protein